MYDKIHIPFTEEDLFRAGESYTHLPGMMDIVSWEQMQKIIAVFGGMRIKDSDPCAHGQAARRLPTFP
jgi:hypothetical protein